jgi:hypothetical protein
MCILIGSLGLKFRWKLVLNKMHIKDHLYCDYLYETATTSMHLPILNSRGVATVYKLPSKEWAKNGY